MEFADAVWEVLNMRGGISAEEKLREIRGVLNNDQCDLDTYVGCLRDEHSRRKKRRKQTGRQNK